MREAQYIVYDSLDELRELYPDAVKHITIVLPNYVCLLQNGKVVETEYGW